jgi:putative pyruvate formate lyase activating enzyme
VSAEKFNQKKSGNDSLYELYENCTLCPRNCRVDRLKGERGRCGETLELRISHATVHFGEEPVLSGTGGSGTVFISGCALGCPFCQNYQISRGNTGGVVDKKLFSEIIHALCKRGVHNINLVTPSHMAPTIAWYLDIVKEAGLKIPVAWNSSGFEKREALEAVAEDVDIWLPDVKTVDSDSAVKLLGTGLYAESVKDAVAFMVGRSSPVYENPVFETSVHESSHDTVHKESGDFPLLKKGVIVRHLVIPGMLESTRNVIRWFAEKYSDRAIFSLMTQYTPVFVPGENRWIPTGQLTSEEYGQVAGWLDEYGIDEGFFQELVPGDEWLPDFSRRNPFSSGLSETVWNFRDGFTV